MVLWIQMIFYPNPDEFTMSLYRLKLWICSRAEKKAKKVY